MRRTLPPAPPKFDRSLFVVMRDFGAIGLESVCRPEEGRAEIIADIASGQIDRVVAVFEFNPVEGWSRNVTSEIADFVEQARRLDAAE